MLNRLSLTPATSYSYTPEEIAVLEILAANRNTVFPGEIATVELDFVYGPGCNPTVSIKIVNAADPEDVYYFNGPKPIDLLIVDKASLTVDIATDADKIAVSSETFLIADMAPTAVSKRSAKMLCTKDDDWATIFRSAVDSQESWEIAKGGE
jgi:hypothetical protein